VLVATRPMQHAAQRRHLAGDGVELRDASLFGDEQTRIEIAQRMRQQLSGQVVVDRAIEGAESP
jgi:hypothetical protein